MRRGDCCKLKWANVDLNEGFITVSTSKTGRKVDIPIADMFRDVISRKGGRTLLSSSDGHRFWRAS
jgi:integrase